MEPTVEVAAAAVSTARSVAREYGIFAVMVIFFIGWSCVREDRLNRRIDAQDTFIRETLVVTVNQNTRAFEAYVATAKITPVRENHESPHIP